REAALAQTPQAKAAALKTVAELERENLDFEQKFKQETAGQISKSFRYQPGSPGSPARGPSARLLTSGEQKAYAGARKALGPGGGAGGGPAAGQRATAIGYRA